MKKRVNLLQLHTGLARGGTDASNAQLARGAEEQLLRHLQHGAVLYAMPRGGVRDDNAALAGIAAAVSAVDEEAGASAHVAGLGVKVVAGGHAPELDFGADGVAAARSEQRGQRHIPALLQISTHARCSGQRADVGLALAAGVVPAGPKYHYAFPAFPKCVIVAPAGPLRAAARGHVDVASVVSFSVESAG